MKKIRASILIWTGKWMKITSTLNSGSNESTNYESSIKVFCELKMRSEAYMHLSKHLFDGLIISISERIMLNPCAAQLEVENKLEVLQELYKQLQRHLKQEQKEAKAKKLEHKQVIARLFKIKQITKKAAAAERKLISSNICCQCLSSYYCLNLACSC